jgi:2,4-dienoyl-CoA reductase-like NADH-dependent reductase (Old Yellow Enzyme family)
VSILLSPVQVGSVEVPNRVAFTAHGSFLDFYRPGISADRYVAYEERRAAGGAGLIFLQTAHVHPSSHALGHFTYDPDDLHAKLAAMATALHRHGTKVVQQLNHFGAQFRSDARENLEPLWAMDDMLSGEGEAAHRMTDAEIREVLDGFAQTARICVEAGLDGVELHGTHGYLLQQSFSPWGNRRDDEWGEPLAFARALIARVREEIGREPVVGLRISTDDFMSPERGGLGVAALQQITAALVDTGGLDYVSQSEGARTGHYARSIGSYRHRLGEFLPLAHALRDAIGARVPVIAASRINEPYLAEQALEAGDCDIVAMTRALIADPDLVEKVRSGGRIRHCVAANQGCVDRMVGGLPITCFHNPDVGREGRGEPQPADERRRVVVVGGGPAGLKAAEIAARRGHDVTLFEREHELGGRLRWVRGLGDAAELFRAVEWVELELGDLGVDVRTGVEAGEAELAGADVVVLATGSRPAPDRLGDVDGSIPVLSIDEAVATPAFEGSALFVDLRGDLESALCAEHVASHGARVTIVTPYLGMGPYLGFTHVNDVLRRLYALGCGIETSTVFGGTSDGEAGTQHIHSREVRMRPFDVVVAGVPGRSETSLAAAAERAGARLLLAGDAVAPRTAMHAFREGDDAGRAA